MEKTDRMWRIQLERGQTIESLIEAGVARGWGQELIAEDLGITQSALSQWCDRLGIKIVWKPTLVRKGELVGADR